MYRVPLYTARSPPSYVSLCVHTATPEQELGGEAAVVEIAAELVVLGGMDIDVVECTVLVEDGA